MRKTREMRQVRTPGDPIHAAIADLRRQIRIRNILIIIVGIEAMLFVALRTWEATLS
ncbi:hypothetical protein PX554_22930 [Sphingomonas sp. H39-1-10]|uniref:hypothetical protein n=1 Tax=Sphingomonas pollutisoli TaxID=3030829 RepID=UPI0023BA0C71|nr:hypothetical protein [Sphingomonas pollutisoli]MDF0490981.1 hypothetical protein [Sphingomonas pollutisoli]